VHPALIPRVSTWGLCDPRGVPSLTAWATPAATEVAPGRPPCERLPGPPRAARCRAGPAHVEEVTAPVTPCWGSPSPTVRDACGCMRGSAAPGGDVPGTDEVSVAPVPAVRAAKQASPRLGDTRVALRAGGRRPPLVHEHNLDARQLPPCRTGTPAGGCAARRAAEGSAGGRSPCW